MQVEFPLSKTESIGGRFHVIATIYWLKEDLSLVLFLPLNVLPDPQPIFPKGKSCTSGVDQTMCKVL